MQEAGHAPQGTPAADGRDPAITGCFRADFRLVMRMVCARRAAAMQLGSGLRQPDASIQSLTPPSSTATYSCHVERSPDGAM